MKVWLNGGLVDAGEAKIAVDDHGLIVGDAAFETLKTVRGEPLAITRHLRRLRRTLDAMWIEMPDEDELRAAVATCIDAFQPSGDRQARVRLTVTGGTGSLGSGAPTGPPSVFVAAAELSAKAAPHVITVPWTRNERGALAGLKTTSYAENVRALRVAKGAGASEAIFANTVDELCEGTGTNIFVVVDGRCITPPLSSGCLAGVTRELVLEVADIAEEPLPMSILETADEVFLTSSTRDVQGLTQIDDRLLEVGPVTSQIADGFARLIAETTDP
ncbi:MAG: aminotransferase class IV [Actinomycetota bacterium]